jgi:hypothetical protein
VAITREDGKGCAPDSTANYEHVRRLAGNWPGMDRQPGFCPLEVAVEHDG